MLRYDTEKLSLKLFVNGDTVSHDRPKPRRFQLPSSSRVG